MTNVQTIVFIQRTLNIDPPIHRAVLYRPLYISVYRYIIPNVNPSMMLSGPFHTCKIMKLGAVMLPDWCHYELCYNY